MKPKNDANTQIRFRYKYNYTRKDKKYTNTKIQTHTNTNFAIGTLSQIRGGEILDFSSKSPLRKTAATLDPEIKKKAPNVAIRSHLTGEETPRQDGVSQKLF